jgi:hypothetical protein
MSSSLEERKEPRSWSVSGARLGLPLGLRLSDASGTVSSAADVPLGLVRLSDGSGTVSSAADVSLDLE